MNYERALEDLLRADRWRMRVMNLLLDLDLAEAYVGGRFVRDAVWDAAHERAPQPVEPVEVIYVDRERTGPDIDAHLRLELSARAPNKAWTVTNVARAAPSIRTVRHALRRAPDTARAAAVRLKPGGKLDVVAPFGLEDIFGLVVRPTSSADLAVLRADTERWRRRFPEITLIETG